MGVDIRMKTKKCKICGDPVPYGIRYVLGKFVCRRCFEKFKYSKRMPRSANAFFRSLVN